MKKIICEMCCGNNLVTEDGVLVCLNCGTKYTKEQSRRMLMTINAESDSPLEKYYINARRALKQQDWVGVERYYDLVLREEPNSIEAIFYNAYGMVLQSFTDPNIEQRRQKMNVMRNNLKLISNVYEVDQREECLEIMERIGNDISTMRSEKFAYNTTRNDFGMVVAADRDKTIKGINEIHLQYIEILREIMKKDPQSCWNNLIMTHARFLSEKWTDKKKALIEIMEDVQSWRERERLEGFLGNNSECQAHYLSAQKEMEKHMKAYNEALKNFNALKDMHVEYTLITGTADAVNAEVDAMQKIDAELHQFLNSRNIYPPMLFNVPDRLAPGAVEKCKPMSIYAVASLAVGIAALLGACSMGIGAFLAPVGVILGIISLTKKNYKQACAIIGIVLSCLSLIPGVFYLLMMLHNWSIRADMAAGLLDVVHVFI